MQYLLAPVFAFVSLLAIFLPLERLFPAHKQPVFRKEWFTDLLFFLGQYLLRTAPVVAGLTLLVSYTGNLPLNSLRALFASQPFWLQCVEVILLCDVGIYWAHRWSHSNRILWRFHRVHHTPFDNLFTRFFENLTAILLGFPLEALVGFAAFRRMWAIYIHSNVSLTPGPLRYLIGAPRLHHWHHSITHHNRVTSQT